MKDHLPLTKMFKSDVVVHLGKLALKHPHSPLRHLSNRRCILVKNNTALFCFPVESCGFVLGRFDEVGFASKFKGRVGDDLTLV